MRFSLVLSENIVDVQIDFLLSLRSLMLTPASVFAYDAPQVGR